MAIISTITKRLTGMYSTLAITFNLLERFNLSKAGLKARMKRNTNGTGNGDTLCFFLISVIYKLTAMDEMVISSTQL